MINFEQFYRRFGIRLVSSLIKPNFHVLAELKLPMESMIHYCDYEGISLGPDNNDSMFNGATKNIQVIHQMELKSNLGFPRKLAYIANEDIRTYHNRNLRLRKLLQPDSAFRDPQTLIVENYTFLLKNYTYVKSFYAEYYKWYNIFSTMIENIVKITETNNRNHFIQIGIPKVIPGIPRLDLASHKDINQDILKTFRDPNGYLLLEFWKWLSEDKEISDKSILSKIPNDKLNKVNFVYKEGDNWIVLNLATLLSFSKVSKKIEEIKNISKLKIDPIQLRSRFLKMIVSINDLRTANIAKSNNVDIEQVNNQSIIEQTELAEQILDDDQLKIEKEKVVEQTVLTTDITDLDLVEDDEETEDLVKKRLEAEDLMLEQELAYLNDINNIQNTDEVKPTKSLNQFLNDQIPPTYEEGIMGVANRLADDNMLSTAEYRRCNQLSIAYKNLKMSDGTPMVEFAQIKPEDLIIEDKPNIKDKVTVLDKSMLSSSLLEFDSRYINNVLSKDIINSVLSVHNAGIAVVDYKIETVVDVLNEYETHVVKLQPVVGKQSTVRFKVPKIRPDGTFLSNGVSYRFRKMRGDLPIRKISSNEVALTSSYGKAFVTRGRKKTYDYGHWLVSQIHAKVLNESDNDITDLKNANVFDKEAKVPRAYSAIATSIKSLDCRSFTLNFDYRIRESLFGSDNIKKFEKYGNVILGISKRGNLLLLDRNNTVYITNGDEVTVFGTIEHFLGLNYPNIPVEFAEATVFNKDVPVGIILSYFLGFENLLKVLKVNPRRVPSHSRLNLSAHEWVIQFNDETLIFSKEDQYSSMILGGFNDSGYYKSIKNFSIYSFDKKAVYLNLLEANGLSVRYIREMELMNKMFIDKITLDILTEMKEPVTYQGLLFRSCELLLDDRHPDALDPKFMRIKGYERISSAVYNELVQSIRFHEGRIGKSNLPIDLNPYAVWERISQDPSKALVNEINPIESLKEIEAVTFNGTGGRSRRSMTKITRTYHKNDIGTISESTVDNSDVGINIFTSANPQFTSLRGMSKPYDPKKTTNTSILSTSALVSPASTHDDPKRV